MPETKIKIEKNKVNFIESYKGNVITAVEISAKTRERLHMGISKIRFAFYDTPSYEMLLDFVRSDKASQITLLPQIPNLNLGFSYCRVDNVYGKLLAEEEIFLVCQKVLSAELT